MQADCYEVEHLCRILCGSRFGPDLVRYHGRDGDHGCRLCACAHFHPEEAFDDATDQVCPDVRPSAGKCGCACCRLSISIHSIL